MEAEDRQTFLGSIENAKTRLGKGQKVFTYKMMYLPAGEILSEDISDDGFNILGLPKAGLEGWEVVNIIPRKRQILVSDVDGHFVGAYFQLKKEFVPEESSELDKLI